AELPLAAEAPASRPAIYVGKTALAAGLSLDDIKSTSKEGLRVKLAGNKLLIAGQNGDSTVRAVARLLEEAWGCRYFMDHPMGMVYPEQATLKVEKIDLTESPKMIYRNIWGAEGAFRGYLWRAWNGHGGVGLPMSHAWGYIKPEEFAAHPDWFRMDDKGQRVQGAWPNFGNAELRHEFIKRAIDSYQGGNVSLSPPD